jgi:hypothetical protein
MIVLLRKCSFRQIRYYYSPFVAVDTSRMSEDTARASMSRAGTKICLLFLFFFCGPLSNLEKLGWTKNRKILNSTSTKPPTRYLKTALRFVCATLCNTKRMEEEVCERHIRHDALGYVEIIEVSRCPQYI